MTHPHSFGGSILSQNGFKAQCASCLHRSRSMSHEFFSGSVAERSKALVLGTSLIEAWVRIPPLPEKVFLNKNINYFLD